MNAEDITKVLEEHKGKVLGKKRIKSIVAKLTVGQPEEPVATATAQTVESKDGSKVVVSVPEQKKTTKESKNNVVIAAPIGVNGQGFIDGKRVNTDVGAFSIKK